LSLDPKLPKDWPELTITRIHLHDRVLNISVRGQSVCVTPTAFGGTAKASGERILAEPLVIALPAGWTLTNSPAELVRPRKGL